MEEINHLKHWAQTFTRDEITPHILSLQAQPLESELFPQEVIPATLANLFHFLARNENGSCEQILYPVIQQMFRHYPRAQQRLVENILSTASNRELASISSQLLNISAFLNEQTRSWLFQQVFRIMFYRQWSDEQVRTTLKHLSYALKIDSQQLNGFIENIQE